MSYLIETYWAWALVALGCSCVVGYLWRLRLNRHSHRAAEAKAADDVRLAAAAKASEDVGRAAEAKAAEDARLAAAAKASEDAGRAAEAKAAEGARLAAAAKAAEDAGRAAEAMAAEDARLAAAAKAAEDAGRAAETKAAEDARLAAAVKASEDAGRAAEAKAADARLAAGAEASEDARRVAAVKAAEDARVAAAAKAAQDARRTDDTKAVEAPHETADDRPVHPGRKPSGISEPGDGKADDLKLIKGIGSKNEGICHDLGIYHLAQIADWSADEATWVGHHMAFPGRIEREHWIEQARLLVAGGDTEHSAGVRAGTIILDSTADAPLNEAELEALSASLPAQAASVEGEAAHEGRRPYGLLSPLHDRADDLRRIRGIGPQNERRLHALGIWHFDQIAAWNPENVSWVGSYLVFPGRIDREKWIAQARDLAASRNSPSPQPTSPRKGRK